MMGKTHISVGVATAMLVTQPVPLEEFSGLRPLAWCICDYR